MPINKTTETQPSAFKSIVVHTNHHLHHHHKHHEDKDDDDDNDDDDDDESLLPAAALPDPGEDGGAGADRGQDVEGWRQDGLGLKVADPQLGPRKLPFSENFTRISHSCKIRLLLFQEY